MSAAFDRRTLITGVAALAASSLLGRFSASAAMVSKPIALGFSLYGLPKLPLADAVALCATTGYDSVELSLMPGLSADPTQLDDEQRRRLRAQLEDKELILAGLMENLPVTSDEAKHREQLERIKRAAELAHQLSPAAVPPLETIVGGKPGEWETFKPLLVDRLRSWAKVAEAERLIVCVKPHAAAAMNRPEEAVWLMQQIDSPWIRLVYDFSHYEHRGFTVDDTLKSLLGYCPFVHVKDRAADTSRLQFLLPGEGTMDYTRFVRLLAAAGYQGSLVVEVSGQLHGRPDYDPRVTIEKCYTHLAQAFERAGVERPPHRRRPRS